MEKVIQIDISILDKEIESLKAELQKKTALREYIQSLAKSAPATSTSSAATNKTTPVKTTPVKTPATATTPAKTTTPTVKAAPKKAAPVKTAKKSSPVKTAPQTTAPSKSIGLTDFVLDYLKKNPKSESKPLIDAFIKATGNKSPGVKANIANTLSRLRKENKLKTQQGNGAGFLWSLK